MRINREKFLKALEVVKPGLAAKELIEQSTSFCFMKGSVITYNDEISISYPIPELDFEGAVNAQELYAILAKMKEEEIEFTISETEILIKSGKAKAGLKLQAEVNLPIEEIGEIKKFKELPDDFCSGINFAAGACSTDMSRPVLTCVHVNEDTIEGSDSFRIANFKLSKSMPVKEFLLPVTSCFKIIKFFPMKVAEGDGWIHFLTIDKALLSCRIIEDKYPDTQKFLKVKGATITFPKDILQVLEKANIFAKREHTLDETINIEINPGKLIIKSTSETGWFEEKSKMDYTGEPINFSVTPYLLKDILKQTNKAILGADKLLFTGDNWKYLSLLKG